MMPPPVWCIAGALLLGACSRDQAPLDSDRSITVFAAASLVSAFDTLGDVLERQMPNLGVRFNSGGSQQLARQLAQGAEGDVFASADERWMRFAEERGLVEAPQVFARNRLVVVFATRPELEAMQLINLASPGLKLVMGAPEVPIGRYARESLRKLSAAPGFGPDFAARAQEGAVSLEDNARSVLAKVRLGEADAGIVYASDVVRGDTGLRVVPIPDPFNVDVEYYIAVLKAAPDSAAARAFVALVRGAEGQTVLARHGFLTSVAAPR
jgi:molybdate transport system substrate-binding protein